MPKTVLEQSLQAYYIDRLATARATKAARYHSCFECQTPVYRKDLCYEFDGDEDEGEPSLIIICQQCHSDWRTLTHFELNSTRRSKVRFGTLRERVCTAHDWGILICREGQRLKDRWAVPVTVPTTDTRPSTTMEIRPLSLEGLALSELTERFENDMTRYGSHHYDRSRFRDSEARQELCRRPGALQYIIRHLESHLPDDTPFIKTGWGNLFCLLQVRSDPDSPDAPESYDDLTGWIVWAKAFLARKKNERQ